MSRLSKAQIDACEKALDTITSGAHLSILRALEHKGIPPALGGKLIGDGRTLLSEGAHHERARCRSGGGTCEGVCDLDEKGRAEDIIGCDVCGAQGPDTWIVPTPLERLKMRLALADTAASHGLAERANKTLKHILTKRDHRYAGPQARLLPMVLGAVDPDRFGEKPKRSEVTIKSAGPTWAHGLSEEELAALPTEAIERLHAIAEMQRQFDRAAHEIVTAALAGQEIPAIDQLISEPTRLDNYPRREPRA